MVVDVLEQRAPRSDDHHLDASAKAEDGLAVSHGLLDQGQFHLVPAIVAVHAEEVGCPVIVGVDIASTQEQDTIGNVIGFFEEFVIGVGGEHKDFPPHSFDGLRA